MAEVSFCLEVSSLKDIRQWCDAVIEQVRFYPDHKAIEKELTDHYIDHVRDLERIGFDNRLACERALSAMGDAEEVGKAMDRAHTPWLGWLWIISKWSLIICLGITACLGIRGEWGNIQQDVRLTLEEPTDYEEQGMFMAMPPVSAILERLDWKSCDEIVERNGYTIKVPYAAIWKRTYEDGEESYFFSAVMTAENWRLWQEGPKFQRTIWLSSSEGQNTGPYVDLSQTDFYMSQTREGLFQTTFEINAWLDDEIPEWVELSCPYGEGFTFHIDWEEARE